MRLACFFATERKKIVVRLLPGIDPLGSSHRGKPTCFFRLSPAARIPCALALSVFVTLGLADHAEAQSLLSQSKTAPDGERPPSTQVGFFELLQSGGEALVGWFEPDRDVASVESPEWNSLKSPRDAVMTFLEAMDHVAQGRREAFPRALKVLGASAEQDASSRQAALDLLHVFDRLPQISPGTIPGSKTIESEKIRRYELFPRGIDNAWAYKVLDGAPKGSIVLIDEGEGWVFEQQTVDGAGDLLESMKLIPPRPRLDRRGQLFISVVEPTFRKTGVSDWLWAVAWAVAGIAVGWGFWKGVQRFRRSRESRGDDLISSILIGISIPALILIVTLGVLIGTTKIYLHPALSDVRWSLVEAAVVLAGVWLAVSLLELCCLGIRRTFFANDDPYARMMSLIVRRSLRIFAVVVLLIFVLQNVFKWNVTALIGGVGVIALALSLAAQDAVKNLFGAVTIFGNRPFLNGDWVRFDGEIGEVVDVSLQVTRIRLLSGAILAVPNMKFIDDPVENLSMRKYLRRVMNIAITYDTPPEKLDEAIEILREILSSEPIVQDGQGDLEQYPPRVWFDRFGSHYLNLRADYWYLMDSQGLQVQRDTERGWFSYLDHATKVNRAVFRRFNEAGIDFAFPTQSIYLASDPDRELRLETLQLETSSG